MTRTHAADVAVIGAGPAGLAAALAARQAGAVVTILDEGARPGGQIFRQLPAAFGTIGQPAADAPSHALGHALLHDVEASGVPVLARVTVFEARPGALAYERDGEVGVVRAKAIVLATGAYDRSVPFPGWTLPGVVTAGAAQVMVRGQMLRPGTRAVVAGTGPLLLPTLTALQAAGVRVVAALEAAPRTALLRGVGALLRSRAKRREAWHYARAFLRSGLRLRHGWTVFAAHGADRVAAVTIGRVDRTGRPRRDHEQRLEADLVCVGFGLEPSNELARRLRCTMLRCPDGSWVPQVDARMATSVAGVFAAGEVVGIGGVDTARAEGQLAGLAAAAHAGWTVAPERFAQAEAERVRERAVSRTLLAAFPVLPGLYELAAPDTLVCRCEDVRLREVREAAALFGPELRTLKMATRAGMGPCQGRICASILEGVLASRLGVDPHRHACPAAQVPVKPVAARCLLEALRELG